MSNVDNDEDTGLSPEEWESYQELCRSVEAERRAFWKDRHEKKSAWRRWRSIFGLWRIVAILAADAAISPVRDWIKKRKERSE